MRDSLVTARLELRPLQQEDARALHRFFADPEAMRYFGDVHDTFAKTEDWVRSTVASSPRRTREYAICLNGDVIGKAGIWEAPELGFFLARDHWGKGYMREVLSVLLPHVARVMDLKRITADVDPRNFPSIRVLQSVGFIETGRAERTIEIAGEWCDSVYLARDFA